MDLFNGIGRPMMRLVEKDLFVWFGNLFPYGGGWRIFVMGLFTLIAAAILAGITIWLLLVHSRNEHIRKVTVPFRFMYWIAGIVHIIRILTAHLPENNRNMARDEACGGVWRRVGYRTERIGILFRMSFCNS